LVVDSHGWNHWQELFLEIVVSENQISEGAVWLDTLIFLIVAAHTIGVLLIFLVVLQINIVQTSFVALAQLTLEVVVFIALAQERVEVIQPDLWTKSLTDAHLVEDFEEGTVFQI
jgi:hypothetical protein